MKELRFRLLGIILALVCLFPAITKGQSSITGEVAGVITDATGATIPGAKVELLERASGATQSGLSNSQGQFRFSFLKPGAYIVTVTFAGMAKMEIQVSVELGQVTSLPVRMSVSGQQTSVEVTAQIPLLDNENANLATTYSTAQLAALPVPGGDITSYAYSAPGVTLNTASGYGNFSSFGLPSTSNLFTTNGNDNMDPYLNLNNSGASNLSLGANELDEIAVVANGYTAQYGRQAGAQVNASTKSGTNQLHGNLLYWWNGRALNANDWFGNRTATPRPFANNNQWAASVGGPIIKDKLFFFVDQEGLRFVLPGSSGQNYLPTPQFATYVENTANAVTPGSLPFYQTIFNLYAGAPGASRATPLTPSDDPNLGCGDWTSNPLNTAGYGTSLPCAMKFVSTQNNLNTEWLLTTRLDYNFSSSDRLFGRFKTDHGIQATGTDPINPIFNADSIQPDYEGQITYSHTFSNNMSNQLIFGGSWYSALFTANNLSGALKAFPTTMAFADGLFTTLGGTDNSFPQGRVVSQYQITDDFTKMKGSHALQFGINFRRNLVSDYATGVNSSGLLTIGSMSEFITGNASTGFSDYSQAFASLNQVRIKLYSLGLYAQDQWKASSKLNLTLAIRADRNANPACVQNCFTLLGGPFNSIGHDPSTPYNATIRTGLNNAFPGIEGMVFSPRIGAAYNLTPNTVLRGGFGLFTDLFPAFIIDRYITNAPNVATFDATGGPLAPGVPGNLFTLDSASNAAFQNGFKSGATLAQLQATVPGFAPPAFNALGNKLLNPKFLEWNIQIERKFTERMTVSANYVGNHGMDVMTYNLFGNAYCKSNCPFGGVIGATAPDSRFGEVSQLTNGGWSNYHGLTASAKFRASSQFQAQLNYTWSHDLDTCSNNCLLPFSAATLTSIRYQVSPTLPGTSYGNADYDVRHNLNANYIYTTKETWANGALNRILGGWSIAGTVYFHTGLPWSPINTKVRGELGNVTGIRSATPLAQYISGPMANCSNPDTPCATSSQFVSATSQAGFGNIARNSFRGPGFFDTDLNVTKTFKLRERLSLSVGANFFNILNHPNFDLPANNVSSGDFGTITRTVSPATSPYGAFLSVPLTGRIVQLNARVIF